MGSSELFLEKILRIISLPDFFLWLFKNIELILIVCLENIEFLRTFSARLLIKMNQEVSQLIGLFQAFESLDPDIRNNSNNAILQMIQISPLNFIFVASQIILLDNIPTQITRLAITLIGRTITPTIKAPLELIAQAFLNPDNALQRKTIKEAVFRGLMFDDIVIRQQAAYSVSLILNIEKDQWIDLFPSLLTVASSNDYPIEAHCGAICCFKTILEKVNIPFAVIGRWAESFFSYLIQILSNTAAFSNNIISESLDCINSILRIIPWNESNGTNNHEIVNKCFDVIEKNLIINDENRVNCILGILKSIFKGIYFTFITDYIQKFLDISQAVLQNGSLNSQLAIFIFWDEIARFEMKQDEDNRKQIILNISQSFFQIILTAISSNLTQYLEMTNDELVMDDLEDNDVYNISSHCLSSFYKASNESISISVMNLFKTTFTDIQQLSAALVSLSSIIKKPIYSPLIDFIESDFQNILFELTLHNNTFIAILAFNVIIQTISKYGSFIRREEDLMTLINYICKASTKNYYVSPYCCNVIFAICKREKRDQLMGISSDNSLISSHFLDLWKIINAYTSEIRNSQIIKSSFDALSALITIIPTSQLGLIEQLTEFIIRSITQTLSISENSSEEILFNIQLAMCCLITSISTRLAMENSSLDLPNSNEIIHLLFRLVKQNRTQIYEESLLAFSGIILCMKSNYAPYISDTVNMLVSMLNTGSPGVIQQVIVTLSDMSRELAGLMGDYNNNIFEHLIPMMYNENFSRELVLDISATLADIIKYQTSYNIGYTHKFYEIIINLIHTININQNNKKEIKFIHSFFEIMMYSFSVIIKATKEDQSNDNSIFREAFALIDLFIKVNIYDVPSLRSFCLFIESIGDKFGKRVQIKLNSRRITNVINKGINEFSNPQLNKQAHDILTYIRNL